MRYRAHWWADFLSFTRRVNGQLSLTWLGQLARLELVVLLLIALPLLFGTHGLAGTAFAATVLFNPTARSVFALIGWFPVNIYGATTSGADTTTQCQNAINAAVAATGSVIFGRGGYKVSTLTYGSNIVIRGAGRKSSTITQIAGTADKIIKPNATTGIANVRITDVEIHAFDNQANTLGGVSFEGVNKSEIDHCRVAYCSPAVLVKGGSGGASSGDGMYNVVAFNLLENFITGSQYGVQIAPAAGATASHPDRTRVAYNIFNSGGTSTALRVDGPTVDAAGSLGVDGIEFHGNTTQSVPTILDLNGCKYVSISANTFECTTGTMTVNIGAGVTNSPTVGIYFSDNEYATHGSPSSLVWNDATTTLTGLTQVFRRNEGLSQNWTYNRTKTVQAQTYSSSITLDNYAGETRTITVTDTAAFTMNAPLHPERGSEIFIEFRNTSGGVMGAVTWNAVFLLAGALTNPANGKRRSIGFWYDGTNWVEKFRSPADIG